MLQKLCLDLDEETIIDWDWIARLKNLKVFSIVGFEVDEGAVSLNNIDKICSLPKLEELSLALNIDNEGHTATIPGMTSLKKLACTGEQLKEYFSAMKFQDLGHLILDGGLATDKDLQYMVLPHSFTLKRLALSESQISDEGLRHISMLPLLRYLALTECYHCHITDAGVQQLSKLQCLLHLELTGCGRLVTDEGFSSIGSVTSLQFLDVSNNRNITDESLVWLSKLTNLRELSIRNNPKITDAGLQVLSELKYLKKLSFKKSYLTMRLHTPPFKWKANI